MIFVSYSHADEAWRKRFETISKPLSRVMPMEFWSDKLLKAGEWEKQIRTAMEKSEAVIFLVSPAFLASDFIHTRELPYFFDAFHKRSLKIFWMLLEPCDLGHYPGRRLRDFQAVTLDGDMKPMASLTDWQWKMAMVKGCEMIDNDFVKPLEKPHVHPDFLKKPSLQRHNANVRILEKPSRRDVEVLVYGGKWWRMEPIRAGQCQTTLFIGDDKSKPGSEHKVVLLTTDTPLKEKTYIDFPYSRTRSPDLIVKRK